MLILRTGYTSAKMDAITRITDLTFSMTDAKKGDDVHKTTNFILVIPERPVLIYFYDRDPPTSK